MIGIIILAHEAFGRGLVETAEHILDGRPERLDVQPVDDNRTSPDEVEAALDRRISALDEGEGVLILTDAFGASHSNAACRLLRRPRIEIVSGVNLPMLIRVLNHRTADLASLRDIAISGGREGILCARQRLRPRRPDAA